MDEFMQEALLEARTGAAEGGIPIGAALVEGNRLVAAGRNRRLQDSASIMHAEINCLYNASRKGEQSFRGMTMELIVVEIASRWFSSSSGDGLLDAHRQLGQDTVLELRSVHQQAHKVSASVQRTPALTQPQRHLEHKVQCAVATLASVLNLTALNTDSRGFVVRRCTQCSTGKS